MRITEVKELKPFVPKKRKNKKGEVKEGKVQIHVGFKVSFDNCPAGLTPGQRVFIEKADGSFKEHYAHGTFVVFATKHNSWTVTGPTRPTYNRLPYKECPIVLQPDKNGNERGLTSMSEAKFREKFSGLSAMAINAVKGLMEEVAAAA